MPVFNQSRGRVVQIIFASVFFVIVCQLINLQLFSAKYKQAAESNALFRKIIYPDRGIIFDRKQRAILENINSYDLVVVPAETKGVDTFSLCTLLNIDTIEYVECTSEPICSKRRTCCKRINSCYKKYVSDTTNKY